VVEICLFVVQMPVLQQPVPSLDKEGETGNGLAIYSGEPWNNPGENFPATLLLSCNFSDPNHH